MSYILGIDQGGTKTVAAVSDGLGRILGLSVGDGTYYPVDGIGHTMSIIQNVSRQAAERAGISLQDVGLAVIGMTGMDFPNQKNMLTAELKRAIGIANVLVYNDCMIAMYGGTRCEVGGVICAGTGLNMALSAGKNREFIYGFYIEEKDQGGSALAKRAVRKVFDSELGLCGPTRLTEMFVDRLHAKDTENLLYLSETDPEFYIKTKALVPEIVGLASEGDHVVNDLLKRMASELTDYLVCGMRKLHLEQTNMEVVLSGSVLKGEENLLTDYLKEMISEAAPNVTVINARYEPIVGAIVMALIQQEKNTLEVSQNIEQTSAAYGLIRTVTAKPSDIGISL